MFGIIVADGDLSRRDFAFAACPRKLPLVRALFDEPALSVVTESNLERRLEVPGFGVTLTDRNRSDEGVGVQHKFCRIYDTVRGVVESAVN